MKPKLWKIQNDTTSRCISRKRTRSLNNHLARENQEENLENRRAVPLVIRITYGCSAMFFMIENL